MPSSPGPSALYPPAPLPVLLATADPALAERMTALVATAGLRHHLVPDLGALARPRPTDARTGGSPGPPVVLVGADLAVAAPEQCARVPGAVVVAVAPAPEQVWRGALRLGAEHVAVLPEAEPWLLDRMLDAADQGPRARVVAVVGGRGGAGASTMAVSLAVTAVRLARRPALVDLDRFGGGVDLMLAAEDEPGLRWADLVDTRGRMRPGVLGSSLPSAHGVHFLTWQRGDDASPSGAATGAVVHAAVREFDLVVLDVPRHLDELGRAGLRFADLTLLLVPAEVRAASAAGRLLRELEVLVGDLRVVVRGPAPTGLPATAVAEALDLPLAGDLRPEPTLAADLDRGLVPPVRGRGPLATLCRRLLVELEAA